MNYEKRVIFDTSFMTFYVRFIRSLFLGFVFLFVYHVTNSVEGVLISIATFSVVDIILIFFNFLNENKIIKLLKYILFLPYIPILLLITKNFLIIQLSIILFISTEILLRSLVSYVRIKNVNNVSRAISIANIASMAGTLIADITLYIIITLNTYNWFYFIMFLIFTAFVFYSNLRFKKYFISNNIKNNKFKFYVNNKILPIILVTIGSNLVVPIVISSSSTNPSVYALMELLNGISIFTISILFLTLKNRFSLALFLLIFNSFITSMLLIVMTPSDKLFSLTGFTLGTIAVTSSILTSNYIKKVFPNLTASIFIINSMAANLTSTIASIIIILGNSVQDIYYLSVISFLLLFTSSYILFKHLTNN
ncbi:hypothetical protein IC006_0921 [Sulfuracidifex tepidarius]|uniref:Uncharacterized protein n=1 Tax=Sulfuracidifex tepidarius TaxID=1294262 RepID=A0A510DTS7_9CREN|nr:hypothetical protein IC006_0921 [Sulfuracidifex tepidarius]